MVKLHLTKTSQINIGLIYNLVKFTAPAFIFGILYTTARTNLHSSWSNYPEYLKKQWHALFIPSILWTSVYLFLMPQLQQHGYFTNLISWLVQFISGNAAPHLWYNTMMLQFIILMPFFWQLLTWVKQTKQKCWLVILSTTIVYFLWIFVYNRQVFHGPHANSWYYFDRLFPSFLIYAVLGCLAWQFHQQLAHLLRQSWPLLLVAWLISYSWLNRELFSFGLPVKLSNSSYYQLSTTCYCLTIIGLICSLAFYQIRKHQIHMLKVFHFLAIYAYRAFLSHVFWLELLWITLVPALSKLRSPLLLASSLYLLTWILSFISAIFCHKLWFKLKALLIN